MGIDTCSRDDGISGCLRRSRPGSRRCIRGYTGWDCRPTEPEHGQQYRQRRPSPIYPAGSTATLAQDARALQIIDDNYRTYYELFVYSFYDSDGDGIGDLQGVLDKLDYLNDGDDRRIRT